MLSEMSHCFHIPLAYLARDQLATLGGSLTDTTAAGYSDHRRIALHLARVTFGARFAKSRYPYSSTGDGRHVSRYTIPFQGDG